VPSVSPPPVAEKQCIAATSYLDSCPVLLAVAVTEVPGFLNKSGGQLVEQMQRTVASKQMMQLMCVGVREYTFGKSENFTTAGHYTILLLSIAESLYPGYVDVKAMQIRYNKDMVDLQDMFGEPFPYPMHTATVAMKLGDTYVVQWVVSWVKRVLSNLL
jgi:hypothetical protein